MKTGILLINLGTPESPKTSSVRRYLREFLSDPRVIDINPVGRWFLVNAIIAPFRAPKSAKSYQKVWLKGGSPLLVYTRQLAEKVQEKLGPNFSVKMAMRYGKPSIQDALLELKQASVKEIRVLPLYPQYASSTTGSTEQKLFELQKQINQLPSLQILPPFFSEEGFLESFEKVGAEALKEFAADYYLFSFHGLPVRHILKSDIGGNYCLKTAHCCEKMVPSNGLCYRAHCFQSAYGIAERLKISREKFTICFQSRLGRTPWIEPFTDLVLEQLAEQGIKKLAVFCPSFVADCLETLEEIGIRAQEQFQQAGGQELKLIPSLNNHPRWVEAVIKMVNPGT